MIAAIFLLWSELGAICLIGVGVMLISLPIQAWVGKFYAKMRYLAHFKFYGEPQLNFCHLCFITEIYKNTIFKYLIFYQAFSVMACSS